MVTIWKIETVIFIYLTPIPTKQHTNLNVSPIEVLPMCELSHWCSVSSVFEWSPDKANHNGAVVSGVPHMEPQALIRLVSLMR